MVGCTGVVGTAFLFPGQNSQYVGMGHGLYDAYPDVRTRFFDRADELLGFALSRMCFEGPKEDLLLTENQQPAIFLVSVATWSVLNARGLQPDAVAGHSLGEYSALVAAGSLEFEQGLFLTRRRGELMAEIGAQTGGIMAAILNLPADEVEAICAESSGAGVVEVANYNSPSQTVISGEEPAVSLAMETALARGARRAVRLGVSAPFHSSLMSSLRAAFEPELDRVSIRDPRIPVVANVTGDYEGSAAEVRGNLLDQLASSVRWTTSIQRLRKDAFGTFVEVGPGKVLTGLMRSIDSSAQAYRTDDESTLESTVNALQSESTPV